jgi:DNA repair protein RecO (recombination protein O)
MRVNGERAYVLHTRPYSESSLLADLFTHAHGRLTVLAKGARRLKSPQRGALLPFRLLVAGWSGRGELPVLTQAEAATAPTTFRGARRYCGFYVNELLVRLMHRHDPHPRLFEIYHDTLRALSGEALPEATLRLFERELLRELGFGLNLEREADTRLPLQPEIRYCYLPARGPLRREATDEDAVTVSGATLLALAAGELHEGGALRESKALMRAVLGYHLQGRPLHTRSLFALPRTYGEDLHD